MIQWGLIKNNLKLMLRNKWILFLMIVLPLTTIGVLSSVFEEYLSSDFDIGNLEAIYTAGESYDVLIPANPIIAKKLPVDPIPSSIDYYGIIYVVYFAWCGIISLAMVISSERKNKIENRLQASPASKLSIYLGKMIPCFFATAIEVAVTFILSILLFGVHWGNIWASAGVLLLMCLAISTSAVFLIYLFRNIVVTIATVYTAMMILGLLGGTFTTYMYGINETNAKWSVIYYVNRTLVEFSTMGKSDYLSGAVWHIFGISLVSVLGGMILMRRSLDKQA